MTMSRALIIDANNRAWAAFHAYDRLSFNGKSVSMIYGLPSMIRGLLNEFNPQEVVMVWDGDRSKHRKRVHPDYKGGREHKGLVDHEDFLRQRTFARLLLRYLGIRQVLNPEQEADDLIYKATRVLRTKGFDDLIIVSGDHDFHQLLSRQVRVYSESRKKMITWKNCKEEFGYNAVEAVDWHILTGDKSDNIKGYGGIGDTRAREFLDAHGSIEDFLDKEGTHRLIDNRKLNELWIKNGFLMDLRHYYMIHKDELKIMFYAGVSNPKIDSWKFLKLAGKFGMRKFVGTSFIKPFIELQNAKNSHKRSKLSSTK